MIRCAVALACFLVAGCTSPWTLVSHLPAAPTRLRIEGNLRTVSAEDIRCVLAQVMIRVKESSYDPTSIYKVSVINRDTMNVYFSCCGGDSFSTAWRIKGRWRLDDDEVCARVLITGNYYPSTSIEILGMPLEDQMLPPRTTSFADSLAPDHDPNPRRK